MINVINYQHSSKKEFRDLLILRSYGHQFAGNPHNARLFQCFFRCKLTSGTYAAHGKKGRTSITILFQKFDHGFGSLLIICNNILNAPTKSCLDSDLIIFVYLDQICDNTLDSRNTFFLFHNSPDTVSVSIIALRDISERIQPGCLSVIGCLFCFQLCVLFLQLFLNLHHTQIQMFTFLIGIFNLGCNLIILFPGCSQNGLLLFLFTLQSENTLADLCLTDFCLFHHCIKSLGFTLDIGAAVQNFNDLIFAILLFESTGFHILLRCP